MSTTEMVAEKVKGLTEIQAKAVLKFIQGLSTTATLSPAELMRLPAEKRRRILAKQARQAEALYRENPDIIMEDAEAPSYE